MKITLLLSILYLAPNLLCCQNDSFGQHLDLVNTIDDYIYTSDDTVLISYKNWWKKDKVIINSGKTFFSIDDGGYSYKSSKITSEVISPNEEISYFKYNDNYSDRWIVVKQEMDENKVITTYFNRRPNLPLMNYLMYSKLQMSVEEIKKHIVGFLTENDPSTKDKIIIIMEKDRISSDSKLSAFCKKVTRPKAVTKG